MKLPLLVSLSSSGLLQFHQDVEKFAEIKEQKSTIDLWVINHAKQYEEVQECHRIFLIYNKIKDIIPAAPNNLVTGSQIIYVPNHLIDDPDLLNKQIQFGFVTSVGKDQAFCRFYSGYDLSILRTMSCSELVSISNLFLLNTRHKKEVDRWLRKIEADEEKIRKEYQDPQWIRIRR